MSTGFECRFIEEQPDVWFYRLQDWDCPVGAFDWRDYSTKYGPFATLEIATRHLSNNHANPGGYGVSHYCQETSCAD